MYFHIYHLLKIKLLCNMILFIQELRPVFMKVCGHTCNCGYMCKCMHVYWRLAQGVPVNDYPIYSLRQGLVLNLEFANPGYLSQSAFLWDPHFCLPNTMTLIPILAKRFILWVTSSAPIFLTYLFCLHPCPHCLHKFHSYFNIPAILV